MQNLWYTFQGMHVYANDKEGRRKNLRLSRRYPPTIWSNGQETETTSCRV